MRVPTYLHLEPRLIISGATPLPILLIFVECSGINLSLHFCCIGFCVVSIMSVAAIYGIIIEKNNWTECEMK